MDGDLIRSSVGLVLGELVNVDHPLLSVYLHDLSLAALASAAHNNDLIVFTDGKRTDSPFLAQVLGESRRHDSLSNVGGSGEVGSSLLSSAAADLNVGLHSPNFYGD